MNIKAGGLSVMWAMTLGMAVAIWAGNTVAMGAILLFSAAISSLLIFTDR